MNRLIAMSLCIVALGCGIPEPIRGCSGEHNYDLIAGKYDTVESIEYEASYIVTGESLIVSEDPVTTEINSSTKSIVFSFLISGETITESWSYEVDETLPDP